MPDTTLKSNTASFYYPKYNDQAFAETKRQSIYCYIHLIKVYKYLIEGSKPYGSRLSAATPRFCELCMVGEGNCRK